MKICLFGSFDPKYPRNILTTKAFVSKGFDIYNCGDNSSGIKHYLNLVKQFLLNGKDCQIIFVGVLGHYDVPLGWLLAKIFHKKLIFDAFYSLYDTYIHDRQETTTASLKAIRFWIYDWLSSHMADKLIFDTLETGQYFVDHYNVNNKKIYELPVTADPQIFQPVKKIEHKYFTVGFYGSFLPLHGIDLIIEAMTLLRNNNLKLVLVGQGPGLISAKQKVKNLNLDSMVSFENYLDYHRLPYFYSRIDLFLAGPFGNTQKAQKVMTAKTVEALSCGIVTIVGANKATKRLLKNIKGDLYFLEKNDPKALASLILKLKQKKGLKKVKNFQKSSLGFEGFSNKLLKIINA